MDIMNIDKSLIDYLEKKFPDQCPDIKDEEKVVWFKSGQSSVVKHLKVLHEDNQKNILDKKLIQGDK